MDYGLTPLPNGMRLMSLMDHLIYLNRGTGRGGSVILNVRSKSCLAQVLSPNMILLS